MDVGTAVPPDKKHGRRRMKCGPGELRWKSADESAIVVRVIRQSADPAPAPLPPVRAEPIAPPKLNATPENPVRPVEHTEPPSGPPAGSATLDNPKPSSDPLPPGAATIFCGVPAIGASVVFVIDRSASMGLEGRFERARREVAASLRRLAPAA